MSRDIFFILRVYVTSHYVTSRVDGFKLST